MIKLLSIADIISIFNALLGFLAIIMIFIDEIHFSFSFILLAIITDGIDGLVARKTKHSNLGEYMEAMGDMISLAIAPALFLYYIYSKDIIIQNNIQHIILILTLTVFISFNMIRLSSFHIMKEKKFFVGLPASASTIIILILSYLKIEFIYLSIIILIISISLISKIHFPKPNNIINIIAAILIIFSITIGKQFNAIAFHLLLFSIIIYTIFGPIYLYKYNKTLKF
jgi:CDP-diacylglycerol--serine O-phosphatidyltransferase